jgi:hypothetical protein
MSAHSDNRAEDFVPGLYPLKVGAIAAINRALGIIAHKPQQAPRVKEYAPDSGNRVDGQSGAANAIVAHTPPPQIEIDHSPLTDDEIAYGQRIANSQAFLDGSKTGTVYRAPELQENQITVISPQFAPDISVAADRVGGPDKKSASKSNASNKSSNRNVKRNPKAVQQVIDYLMRNPDDMALTVAQLTDKLKYDVRMKVGHSSVGKAMGVMKADGKEKAS